MLFLTLNVFLERLLPKKEIRKFFSYKDFRISFGGA